MKRFLLLLNGVVFLATAVWAGIDPARASEVLGFPTWGDAGGQEFAANFIGLYAVLGIGLLGTGISSRSRSQNQGMWLLALCASGLAVGRLFALATGLGGTTAQYAYLAWESVTGLIAWISVRSQRS